MLPRPKMDSILNQLKQQPTSSHLEHVGSYGQEFMTKLNQLEQLMNLLMKNERDIREQATTYCKDLKAEVEQVEANHRKVQECIKNIKL